MVQGLHEGPVDLQLVGGQVGQVGERRVAGAEVVDRDAGTERAQTFHDLDGRAPGLHHCGLGDLGGERAAGGSPSARHTVATRSTRPGSARQRAETLTATCRSRPARRQLGRLPRGLGDHEHGQRTDQLRALRDRDELVRRHHPPLRVLPAQQGLHADDASGRQVDLRLVEEHQLAVADRPAQPAGEHEALLGVQVLLRSEHEPAAATFLGRAHGDVGVAQQVDRRGRRGVHERDADARVHLELQRCDLHRRSDRLEQLVGATDRLGLVGRQDDRGELVAAEVGHELLGGESLAEAAADGHEHVVPPRVTERVVHVLEAVEVDEEHRDGLTRDQLLVEVVLEPRPVGQPGERLVSGEQDGSVELHGAVVLEHEDQTEQR